MNADGDPVHYHHIAGMGGGYMPDQHGLYDSFESAVSSVEDDISSLSDYGASGPERTFSRDYFEPSKGGALWVGYYPEDVSPHDLGWYYEVTPSRDSDADHEDCRAILNGEKEMPLW